MKINADLVIELRKKKSWSQDELSTVSGLNLRTIQRIENEGSASLQSKKALASAFDIDANELNCKELDMVEELKGKTIQLTMGAGLSADTLKGYVEDLNQTWLKLKIRKKTELINLASVSKIKIID